MKKYNRETDGRLPKGQMFMDGANWPGIIVEAERTKKYGENNIINMVEIYGFEHEMGSKYANEITHLLTEDEFELAKSYLGFDKTPNYFKGKLIGV